MLRSIRWRIAIPYVVLIIAIFIAVEVYLTSYIRQTLLGDLEQRLLSQALLMKDALEQTPQIWTDAAQLDVSAKRWAQLLDARITLIGADGVVLGESHENKADMENHLNRIEIHQALTQGQGSSTRFSSTVNYPMIYTAVLVSNPDGALGFVRIALPTRQVEENLDQIERTIFAAMVVAAGLALVLAIIIAERISKPLRLLTQEAIDLASADVRPESRAKHIIPHSQDEVGQLSKAFNIMTARLSAQINALTLESSKLNAVLQEMTDGVVIVDRDGLIQLINPAAEKMFTAQVDKTLGRSLAEILRHYQIVELWQKCLETGETQVVTLDLGIARLYLQGIATPLGAAMPGSTLLLFQDLTKLRHLETVRRDFISNISHELRTPLASLKALTETLQDSIVHDPDASPKFLERMETEVDSLSLMVAELVELSRIESGKVPLHFAATQPRAILESAYQRLRLQAERAELVVTLDCPPDLPLVLVDQDRIEQVVMNLLHNAIKFTPAGGSISLSASLGQAGTGQAMVVFSIRDSGVGIHPDDLPRIFERFYKADRARSGGGTGLGLAIARHLVEAHAGKIWAESVLDQGSTFYFSVPVYTSV